MNGINPSQLEQDANKYRFTNFYGCDSQAPSLSKQAPAPPDFAKLLSSSRYKINNISLQDKFFSFDLKLAGASRSKIYCFTIASSDSTSTPRMKDFKNIRLQFYDESGVATKGDSVSYELNFKVNPIITKIFVKAFKARPNDDGDIGDISSNPILPLTGPKISREELRKMSLATSA